MKENILILVNSFISCSKKQYFKTQLINTEHRTQNTDTEHRTQTHVKNGLVSWLYFDRAVKSHKLIKVEFCVYFKKNHLRNSILNRKKLKHEKSI